MIGEIDPRHLVLVRMTGGEFKSDWYFYDRGNEVMEITVKPQDLARMSFDPLKLEIRAPGVNCKKLQLTIETLPPSRNPKKEPD